MSETKEKKGGFLQVAQVSSSGGCCGSASGSGCCGEPVQQATIPVAAVSCCGEPAQQTATPAPTSSTCCG